MMIARAPWLECGLASLGLCLICVACSPAPATDPSQTEGAAEPAPERGAEVEAAAPAEPEPARPSCDDGTCFECGDGWCPKGAYCDGSAPGGAACAWIQECPGDPSCSCLLKVLGSSCKCDSAAAGPQVSCS